MKKKNVINVNNKAKIKYMKMQVKLTKIGLIEKNRHNSTVLEMRRGDVTQIPKTLKRY